VLHIEWLLRIAPQAHVVLRSNGLQSHIATAAAGEAMAVLPRILGDRIDSLTRLEAPLAEPVQPIKLGVHADMRDTARIRALIDYLVRELKALAPELNPTHSDKVGALRSAST
jgi:DNA-binding transcriptional LysR family regulator